MECSFCKQPKDSKRKLIQSETDPTKFICFACVGRLKVRLDKELLEDFREKYRPDEDERTD